MKRYEDFKDTLVEWIGEVPNHWEVSPMKRSVALINVKGTPSIEDVKVSPENVESGTGKCISMYSDYDGEGLVFNIGDVLLNKLRIYLKKILITETNGFSMGEMIVLRCKNDIVNKFFYYILFHQGLIDFLDSQANGVKLPRVSPEVILNSKIPVPPLPEQTQIVAYLDAKTAAIDDLIRKKEQKIALLKEYRSALINRAVTKGLDPTVPMKDSGVEWIGEVPGHWETPVGSRLGVYSKGNGIRKDEVIDSGLPCIRYGQIYTTYNHAVSEVYSFISSETSENAVPVGKGTLLITGSGETKADIGKCIVYIGEETVWVGGDIIILQPDKAFNPYYLTYLMNSECVRIQKETHSKGEIVVHIYSKNFAQMRFLLPPLTEQQQIVAYLDEQTAEIDAAMELEQQKIALLKEYRQSLISSVVTGKIKVTDE